MKYSFVDSHSSSTLMTTSWSSSHLVETCLMKNLSITSVKASPRSAASCPWTRFLSSLLAVDSLKKLCSFTRKLVMSTSSFCTAFWKAVCVGCR